MCGAKWASDYPMDVRLQGPSGSTVLTTVPMTPPLSVLENFPATLRDPDVKCDSSCANPGVCEAFQ